MMKNYEEGEKEKIASVTGSGPSGIVLWDRMDRLNAY
jgi:hypothetical protein